MAKSLSPLLKQKLEGAANVAILAVGSELRGDDASGIIAAHRLEKISRKKKSLSKIKVFIGASAPENLTGEIKRFQPSHLIIIDSADLGLSAGETAIIEPENILGVSFSTHSLPLKVMIHYLRQSCNCRIIIIGIQPKNVSLGAPVSKEVTAAIKGLTAAILNLLDNN